MDTENQNSPELTDEQMDALVAESERPMNREVEMEQAPAEKSESPENAQAPEQAEAQKAAEEFFEFQHSGKNVKATREQIINWARMGIDYPQKAQKLNQQLTHWNQEREQWEKKWGNYRQIDEWAQKNPDQWRAVEEAYRTRAQQAESASAQDPYRGKFKALESELNQMKSVLTPIQERLTSEQRSREDEALNQEVQTLRDKYKDLGWDTPDAEGKTLEWRILEHAQNTGIKKFTTAFRDYCHDMLIDREVAQAKQSVAKGIQAKTKMGILSESQSPKKGFSAPKNIREMSYDDLEKEALAEFLAQKNA